MSFLQERGARIYFTTAAGICVCFLLSALLFGASQPYSLRTVLRERELALVTALLEQGVEPSVIAHALQNHQVSKPAEELLSKAGRGDGEPVWLPAPVRTHTVKVLLAAVTCVLVLSALQMAAAALFLQARDQQLDQAAAAVTRYAEGDFCRRLPRTGLGAQGRLFAAVDQLATAMQAKSETEHRAKEFLRATISDISHQLKTPLSALQMYIEIIAAEPENPKTVRAFTGKSLTSLARMEGLVGMLLKLARLDAGSIVFAGEWVSVPQLAGRASEELLTRAAHEGKRLTFSGAPDAVLYCDPAWTAEALGNLIKNALDHTKADDEIKVLWETSPGMLRITVSDTGEGIAPLDLYHIFKRFYRAPASGNTPGVGLGLPLARAIVEGQGGTLSVQSEPGAGTAFTATFLTKL